MGRSGIRLIRERCIRCGNLYKIWAIKYGYLTANSLICKKCHGWRDGFVSLKMLETVHSKKSDQ